MVPLAGVFFCASSCRFPCRTLQQVTLRGFRILSVSICLSCSCSGAISVAFAVSLVQRVFSVLSLALPTAPAVLCSSPYYRLPFGVSASSLLLPARLLLWWRRLGSRFFPCVLSASPAPAGLPMFGVLCPVWGFCHQGCPFSLYGNLVVPYGSPRLSGFVCWSVRFLLLQGGCASGLRDLGSALAALFVQFLQLFFVGSPSAVPVCPPQALVGQVVWLRSFPPSCCSWRLCSLGVSAAAFCPLAILSHPLLLFLTWGSSSGVCSGLGW